MFHRASRLAVLLIFAVSLAAGAEESHDDFFERQVRPVLVEKCGGCHGPKKQSGGLRLDSRAAILQGGDSGPAITLDKPMKSLLLEAVRREGDVEMPPEETLKPQAIAALEQWVKLGAPWPKGDVPLVEVDPAKDHWAFQPVKRPEIPRGDFDSAVLTPIDAFVFEKLQQHSLAPSPPADRRTLIRRAYYALTGLPPTPAEVEQFVNDPDQKAYYKLVETLLASPHYGEHWARRWLDVARYSDTKGYVYAREERFWTHAWAYRDWVTGAFNDDLPYDQFLLLQLAADQVKERPQSDLAAMGYLTLGRRFLGVQRDIIDDRIDVVCRGTMALTVSCARCHDHKYDPIPTADYYSLYGVFDSCHEAMAPVDPAAGDKAFQTGLKQKQDALEQKLEQHQQESSARARTRVADYLFAQSELHKYPADGFDQIFAKTDLLPAFVRRWERYLREAGKQQDAIFAPWRQFAELSAESFGKQTPAITESLASAAPGEVNPLVAQAFATPPASYQEVCARYGELFTKIDQQWQAALAAAKKADQPAPKTLADPHAEALRRVLYGPLAPSQVPPGPVSFCEGYFDSGSLTELWKLQGALDRFIINAAVPYSLTLVDQATPVEPRIFRRGDPLKPGRDTPRQFLRALSGKNREPFEHGSGRLELAQAIIDPQNPLTARVMVNRIWAHHFGVGLVPTTSDFGARAGAPSHPELLDWLAAEFVAEGWSLKKLHRTLVLSATFRQQTTGPADQAIRQVAQKNDPQNRLLWRMNARRLTFEEFRDSLLAAASDLDRSLGGKPSKLFTAPYPKRRTLYGLVDRQYLPSTLRMFDFANPDLHVSERTETTVPQQALFLLNHPLVLAQAKSLAATAQTYATSGEGVAELFQRVFQREPTPEERADALAFVDGPPLTVASTPPPTAADWSYGYGELDEAKSQVVGFTKLPHYTGSAWQGGGDWPDSKLGWVQLTASGGHPGNTRKHAAIRRWTAPRNATIKIQSTFNHEPTPGDGVRAFIVHSTGGVLQTAKLHHSSADMNVEPLEVKQGDTIDFLVDIDQVLNSDQYLWSVVIQEVDAEKTVTWNASTDFPEETVSKLTQWEQLAHVLLCSNEFMFVD